MFWSQLQFSCQPKEKFAPSPIYRKMHRVQAARYGGGLFFQSTTPPHSFQITTPVSNAISSANFKKTQKNLPKLLKTETKKNIQAILL
jgi:hypothetical protein